MVVKFKWAALANNKELLEFGASDSNNFASCVIKARQSEDLVCFEVQMGLSEIQYVNRMMTKGKKVEALDYIRKKCPVIGFPSECNAEFSKRWRNEKIEVKT